MPGSTERQPCRPAAALRHLGITPHLILVILLMNLSWVRPVAAGEPLSLADYWAAVQHTQTQIAEMIASPPADLTPALGALAREWEARTVIRLDDGTLLKVDHSVLVARLRAEPPDLDGVEATLRALLAARESWPAVEPAPVDAATRLDEILDDAEFQWPEERPEGGLERLWREFITQLLSGPGRGTELVGPGLLTVLGAAVVALALLYALRGTLGGLVTESRLSEDDRGGIEGLTADLALQQARNHSGAGDYRTAVRFLYLSTLLLLEERGRLQYDRSRTNREYLRSVADRPELASTLADVVEVFDRVWYGFQPLSETSYARYQAQVEQLREQQ